MIVQETAYSVTFPGIPNLRRRVFHLEEYLSAVMTTPFELLPIPDDAPVDIPRITAVSKNGYSRLAVSPTNLTFQTTYDEKYSGNWGLCHDYLQSRITKISSMITDLSMGEAFYQGLIVKMQFPRKSNGVAADLFQRFFKPWELEDAPSELSFRVSFASENTFYSNWQISNANLRQAPPGEALPVVHSLSDVKLVGESVEVLLDINDRLAFNTSSKYRSVPDVTLRLLEIVNDAILHRIHIILKGADL